MKNKFLIVFIITILFANVGFSQNGNFDSQPQRIILNITDEPNTSVAVTWRTITKTEHPEIQYAVATGWRQFEDSLHIIPINSHEFVTDELQHVFYYSGLIHNLNPNTTYVYRVGSDSVWSEWNQFKTGKGDTELFKFVFFGDPQNENKNHVSRVFREAFRTAPDADFWLFTGDLLAAPHDELMDEFFFAGDFMFRSIPIVMTPGNHDREFLIKDGGYVLDKRGNPRFGREISELFKVSFTLPENGPSPNIETSFYYDYQGARFILIDSNKRDSLDIQIPWLENLLKNNPNEWTIVAFHHPIFSSGGDRDNDETRNAFMPLFDKYNVDLVLTGHDHTYSRSFKLNSGKKINEGEKGTVYVVSVSGPKMYSVNERKDNIMAKYGGHVQLFQVISVDHNKLSYKSYTATGKLYDEFELDK